MVSERRYRLRRDAFRFVLRAVFRFRPLTFRFFFMSVNDSIFTSAFRVIIFTVTNTQQE